MKMRFVAIFETRKVQEQFDTTYIVGLTNSTQNITMDILPAAVFSEISEYSLGRT